MGATGLFFTITMSLKTFQRKLLATTLQEETIIFALIERAQFGANAKVTTEMRIHLCRPLDSTILYMPFFLSRSVTLRLLDMRSSLWLAAFRKKVYERGGGSVFSAGGDKASLISGSFLDFMMASICLLSASLSFNPVALLLPNCAACA